MGPSGTAATANRAPRFRDELASLIGAPCIPDKLPIGLCRSYGDSCLNTARAVIEMCGITRFITFDRATGVLRAEAGVSLSDILRLVVPEGWFLPTTPGTRFVTLGGAIANDVHGKNHHGAGTIGRHVRSVGLLRSDRRRAGALLVIGSVAGDMGGGDPTSFMARRKEVLVVRLRDWRESSRRLAHARSSSSRVSSRHQ
jgi:FAD/FMN-containing dehydrogenase